MLSIFPELLSYQLAATSIIRLAAGFLAWAAMARILSDWPRLAIRRRFVNWLIGSLLIIYAGAGALLIIGLFTQAAGLITAVASLLFLVTGYYQKNYFSLSPEFFWLMAAINISLLLSGAGWWALDWPI